MLVKAIKTNRIRPETLSIFDVLDKFLPPLSERSIVAVTSKLVSICEGNLVPFESATLLELVEQQSDYYLSDEREERNLTITRGKLIPKAGIDNSEYSESYILWPKDSQKTANEIREYLVKKTSLKSLGVLITDSTSAPLMRGVRGISLAHSGFLATKKNKSEVLASVVEGLAAASVVVMGEGSEQTPLAVLSDLDFVDFVAKNPSADETQLLRLNFQEDMYSALLQGIAWNEGRHGKAPQ